MNEHEIRHLPVVVGSELVGVVSDRDLSLVQTLAQASPETLTVEDAMTPEPYVVAPNVPLQAVARAMIRRKIGSAVVVDSGSVVGVFTVTDALQALVEVLEGTATRRAYEGDTATPAHVRGPGAVR
jgi:acetoin utilization protein AcuB